MSSAALIMGGQLKGRIAGHTFREAEQAMAILNEECKGVENRDADDKEMDAVSGSLECVLQLNGMMPDKCGSQRAYKKAHWDCAAVQRSVESNLRRRRFGKDQRNEVSSRSIIKKLSLKECTRKESACDVALQESVEVC